MQQLLRHVVLFGFKDETTEAVKDEIVRRFVALKDQIEGIAAFEWGTNVSPEGLDQGHSHCFIPTFESDAARDAYLPHPAHVAFGDFIRAHKQTVTVVDFWSRPET